MNTIVRNGVKFLVPVKVEQLFILGQTEWACDYNSCLLQFIDCSFIQHSQSIKNKISLTACNNDARG